MSLGLDVAFMCLKWLFHSSLDIISQDRWCQKNNKLSWTKHTHTHEHKQKYMVTIQCFSFQFGTESNVGVVQYSGSQAQEVVQLGKSNINSLADFKQWVYIHTHTHTPTCLLFGCAVVTVKRTPIIMVCFHASPLNYTYHVVNILASPHSIC